MACSFCMLAGSWVVQSLRVCAQSRQGQMILCATQFTTNMMLILEIYLISHGMCICYMMCISWLTTDFHLVWFQYYDDVAVCLRGIILAALAPAYAARNSRQVPPLAPASPTCVAQHRQRPGLLCHPHCILHYSADCIIPAWQLMHCC